MTGVIERGKAGRHSDCLEYESTILGKLDGGLSAQRIWQDLVVDHGFGGSYQSVKRFVQRLRARHPDRVWRMECLPAEEAQVDFCSGYWLVDEKGHKRRVHVLRMVLSHSRKGYSQAVLHQDTESFLRCVENGFRHYGGVPATVCLDNLKAAVSQADWHDPTLNPKILEFARHYGCAFLPTRPRTPQHKGKVENAVNYVQRNALANRKFTSLTDLNAHLLAWEKEVADRRIHGTTRRQVEAHFQESERSHLKELPTMIFAFFNEGQRQVHRDSYVEVNHSFYEVPPEYIGHTVWVRWDARMVRVFNVRMESVISHARVEAGRFSRTLGAQGVPCASLEESCRYYTEKAAKLGVHAAAWAEALIEQRGPQAIRILQGLLGLAKSHTCAQIDEACRQTLESGQWRFKELRRRLDHPSPEQKNLPFLESHPLIRDPMEYGQLMEPFDEKTTPTIQTS